MLCSSPIGSRVPAEGTAEQATGRVEQRRRRADRAAQGSPRAAWIERRSSEVAEGGSLCLGWSPGALDHKNGEDPWRPAGSTWVLPGVACRDRRPAAEDMRRPPFCSCSPVDAARSVGGPRRAESNTTQQLPLPRTSGPAWEWHWWRPKGKQQAGRKAPTECAPQCTSREAEDKNEALAQLITGILEAIKDTKMVLETQIAALPSNVSLLREDHGKLKDQVKEAEDTLETTVLQVKDLTH
ncbi:hypothetical protein NDU88_003635 [Pleurodeles waltl]|uniref:Uncharacterized protein n=1 Tax=Pleurodeles waltl TaxID=8319 RepID=A0AAV7WRW4_PLEWA|nr:hypothetical protein NDU88_003635 [Pleurodeles waltl]